MSAPVAAGLAVGSLEGGYGSSPVFNTGIRQDKADAIITMETSAARNCRSQPARRAYIAELLGALSRLSLAL
jgi:hypothetical protein